MISACVISLMQAASTRPSSEVHVGSRCRGYGIGSNYPHASWRQLQCELMTTDNLHGCPPVPLPSARTHVHLQFGIYTSAGNYTCHAKKANCSGACNVGSLGHYPQDAATFAKWGLDFIKMDWCSASVSKLSCPKQYGEMAAALNATGRPITFYMSCGGEDAAAAWPAQVSNIWRIGFDHLDCWTDGPCPKAVGYTSRGRCSTIPRRPCAHRPSFLLAMPW